MKRTLIFVLLVTMSLAFLCEIAQRRAGAQESMENEVSKILENQNKILMRIDALDKKLDVIKMRIKL